MTEGPPRTWDEYKARVAAKLAEFNALGLSRYTDGRAQWAAYVAYQQAQHAAWLAYEKAHYQPMSFDEGQRALAAARAAVRDAEAGDVDVDEDRFVAALHQLEIINYELWHTPFSTTDAQVRDHTADLSDPFQPIRDVVEDAEDAVARFQQQVDPARAVDAARRRAAQRGSDPTRRRPGAAGKPRRHHPVIDLVDLQVWAINDGAEGRVVLEWIERSSETAVPACSHVIVIARSEAEHLAKLIMEAIDA